MNFTCIGGDRRQINIAEYLIKNNHSVTTFGLPENPNIKAAKSLIDAIIYADAVILPLPVSRDDETVSTPLSKDVVFLQDILHCRPKIIFGGIIKEKLAIELINNTIPYYDYYTSESLTIKNAVLTAEAALSILISSTDTAIYSSKALVIGYGRIGKRVANYLKTLGADVTATSRNESTITLIETDGYNALNTNECASYVHNYDYIINTVPYPLLDYNFFSNCKKSAFVQDLATDSGIDLKSAANFGIKAAAYPSLPGKHSPITAAKYIAEEILNQLKLSTEVKPCPAKESD